ncbi:hypothetical protein D3C72_717720 [compost metagenome]
MGLPVRAGMAQEPPALDERQPGPEPGHVGLERIHHGPPGHALRLGRGHLAPDEPCEGGHPQGRRGGVEPVPVGRRLALGRGQLGPARHQVHPRAGRGLERGHRHVHGGEPGAHEQRLAARRKGGDGRGGPWVVHVPRPRLEAARHPERRRRKLPDREDHLARQERPPRGQPQPEAAAGRQHAHGRVLEAQEPPARQRPGDGLVQLVLDVSAVQAARRVGSDTVLSAWCNLAACLQPAYKTRLVTAPGAHLGGRDVQPVAGDGGAVGHAAAGLGAALDQGDRQGRARLAQQIRRHHRAGEAAAHDGDVHGLERVHRGLLSGCWQRKRPAATDRGGPWGSGP